MVTHMGALLARTFLGRTVLIWTAATCGWTIGSLVYFGYLYVALEPAQPGELHIGVYILGFLGLAVAVTMTRRWIERVRESIALLD